MSIVARPGGNCQPGGARNHGNQFSGKPRFLLKQGKYSDVLLAMPIWSFQVNIAAANAVSVLCDYQKISKWISVAGNRVFYRRRPRRARLGRGFRGDACARRSVGAGDAWVWETAGGVVRAPALDSASCAWARAPVCGAWFCSTPFCRCAMDFAAARRNLCFARPRFFLSGRWPADCARFPGQRRFAFMQRVLRRRCSFLRPGWGGAALFLVGGAARWAALPCLRQGALRVAGSGAALPLGRGRFVGARPAGLWGGIV